MQAENRVSVLVGLGHNVYRSGGGVDDGRRNDADLGPCSHAGTALHGDGNGCRSGGQHADLPERACVRASIVVGIEGVNGVVHGRCIHYVVSAFSRDRDVGKVEYLSDDRAVGGKVVQFPERVGIHVNEVEDGLVGVPAGARVGVMPVGGGGGG